jgi:predicted Zn-dependent peptidase
LQPAHFKGGEFRAQKDLEQVHFTLALEGPTYRDNAIYTAQVYASIIGGGMSSRLFQEIREKRGLCYTVFAQAGAHEDTGMITLYAGTAADQIGDLARVSIDELRRAADDISDAEVERARVQMKAGMLMGLESPSNRAERLARMVSIWGRVPKLDEVVDKIDAVDTASVRAMAGDLAGNANSAMALYGPIDSAPSLEELKARLAA